MRKVRTRSAEIFVGQFLQSDLRAGQPNLLGARLEPGALQVEISRFKGLGEMPARYLRATTMDPAQRILLRVKLPERADPAALESIDEGFERTEKLVETLMGRRPELRFDYIQKNARFARDLDL